MAANRAGKCIARGARSREVFGTFALDGGTHKAVEPNFDLALCAMAVVAAQVWKVLRDDFVGELAGAGDGHAARLVSIQAKMSS
jgi:hypothetical protein